MMKKKNLLATFLLATAGFFSSCNDDDNSPAPIVEDPHILEGTWKAETLSYQVGPSTHEWDFDHPSIKQGCATDYLTIASNGTAELTENNKNGENCEDEILSGTWTEEVVTIEGEASPRQIISADETTLILVYPMTFGPNSTDVTVTYSRQ